MILQLDCEKQLFQECFPEKQYKKFYFSANSAKDFSYGVMWIRRGKIEPLLKYVEFMLEN